MPPHVTTPWNDYADRALAGECLTRQEALSVLNAADEETLDLLAATYRVRRHHFGNRVQLYYLVNAKSGLCPEDCHYCSQSKLSTAVIEKHPWLDQDALLERAGRAVASGATTYCMVASGRGPTEAELDHFCAVVRAVKEAYPLRICACLGLLTEEQARRLKSAGVDRVNHNLNTSERHHASICGTHGFQDRLATLRAVKAAGLETCCGGILGMGESADDVVDLALSLRELEVDSLPVNFLIPIEGTPLQGLWTVNPRYCLRALCLFRLLNPASELRLAGGRELHLRSLQPLALYAANSIFVGDYLTTEGQAASLDHRMIADLGFEVVTAAEPALAMD